MEAPADQHSPLLVGTGITGGRQPGVGREPGPARCSLRRVRQTGDIGTGVARGTGCGHRRGQRDEHKEWARGQAPVWHGTWDRH